MVRVLCAEWLWSSIRSQPGNNGEINVSYVLKAHVISYGSDSSHIVDILPFPQMLTIGWTSGTRARKEVGFPTGFKPVSDSF